ncbi:MAG: phosphate ABC transporter ATP-binding protein PstB [Acidimicrobiales bacterium]
MIEAEATGARVEEGVAVYGDEVVVDQPEPKVVMTLADVAVAFGGRTAVRDVTFDVHAGEVTALIGPSGSGKTTLLRALNRMHDTVRTAAVTGTVQLGDLDVYAPSTDPTLLRSRVGMVFQRPNPFPTMSIYENAVAGLKFNGVRKKSLLDEAAESALVGAALWDSVKDRMKAHASTLSGGEQQRLCIARALAVEPEVLLMDEPTSALDPIATKRIEELVVELKDRVTIIIVTHNMQQAMRVSDRCAFLLMGEDKAGELIEFGPTATLFSEPTDPRTLDYVNGRFG